MPETVLITHPRVSVLWTAILAASNLLKLPGGGDVRGHKTISTDSDAKEIIEIHDSL